ncbi:MAG: hypothetical protein ACRCVU_11745 [Flavobacterium sp.]
MATSKELFTSDLHFGHRKIVEYTNRGVDTTQEDHDRWLIDLWNSQVDKNTTVYSLGDFVFNCRKLDKFKSVTDRLNGQKILIRGNHCSREVYQKSGFQWYDLKGFNIEGQYIVMCHYAMRVWDKYHHGSWQLYGHSHGSLDGVGKQIDVGLESAYNILGEHRFFTMDDLRQIMSEREVVFHDHHTERTNQ